MIDDENVIEAIFTTGEIFYYIPEKYKEQYK